MTAKSYAITFSAVVVHAEQDLFEITAGEAEGFEIVDMELVEISDVGEAQSEIANIQIVTGYSNAGSGGAAAAVRQEDPRTEVAGDPSFTAKRNNTTIASAATGDDPKVAMNAGWFLQAPFKMPAHPIQVLAGDRAVVRLIGNGTDAALYDPVTMYGTIWIKERPDLA